MTRFSLSVLVCLVCLVGGFWVARHAPAQEPDVPDVPDVPEVPDVPDDVVGVPVPERPGPAAGGQEDDEPEADPEVAPGDDAPQRIVFQISQDDNPGTYDIAIVDADGKNLRRLTDDGKSAFVDYCTQHCSPDGKRVAFVKSMGGSRSELWVMNIDGSDEVQLSQLGGGVAAIEWSPDGEHILFGSNVGPGVGWHLYVVDSIGERGPRRLAGPHALGAARWQDAGSIVYAPGEAVDLEGGKAEVGNQPPMDASEETRRAVSTDHTRTARIVFQSSDTSALVLETGGERVTVDRTPQWFHTRVAWSDDDQLLVYAVARDVGRFSRVRVMLVEDEHVREILDVRSMRPYWVPRGE